MGIISSILAPQFLVARIPTIGLLVGAVLLVLFSDFVNRKVIFKIAHGAKHKTHTKITGLFKSPSKRKDWYSEQFSNAIATFIFVSYCYLGARVIGGYIFIPILTGLSEYITLVVIFLFFLLSWTINTEHVRKRFMKF